MQKKTLAMPIDKKDDRDQIKNHRPVSPLNVSKKFTRDSYTTAYQNLLTLSLTH